MKFNLIDKILILIVIVQLSAILVIDKFAVNSNISNPAFVIIALLVVFSVLDITIFKLVHIRKKTVTA